MTSAPTHYVLATFRTARRFAERMAQYPKRATKSDILATAPMRFLALALTFAVAGAPIAAEVCETTCVEHVSHSENLRSGSHHHHGSSTTEDAGHHVATQQGGSADGILATSVSHDCCYTAAVLTDSRYSKRTAPSASLTTPSTGATAGRVSQPAKVGHRGRLPALVRPLSQLRV